MSKLAAALFTKTQQNVLRLLYGQPDRSFFTKEILRLTGMGVHTIKRELDRMVDAGIVTIRPIGNQKHYQANPKCPLYTELVSVVKKTVGVVDVLRDALQVRCENVELAFVYGSVAKGEEHAGSDLDLMVVGNDLTYGGLMEQLSVAESTTGRTINPTIYSPNEFRDRLRDGNHFIESVWQQDKLFVIGDKDDFGAVE